MEKTSGHAGNTVLRLRIEEEGWQFYINQVSYGRLPSPTRALSDVQP